MTIDRNNTNPKLRVAIDVSKLKHDVLIEYSNGSYKRLTIMNDLEGFHKLADTLNGSNLPVFIGLEATGYYHRAIAHFLIQQKFNVSIISSIAVARTRDAQYNSRDKHDIKDTKVILYLLKAGTVQYYYDPIMHGYNDIQELSNTHYRVSFRKTQLQHSIINHYLALYFPEAEKYFCSTRAKWFADFMYKFPCPAAITCYDEKKFIEQAWALAGRKVSKINWLKDVYKTAKNSIGLPVESTSQTIAMFQFILNEFSDVCQRRTKIERIADTYLINNLDYQRLKTIPGIGPIIALTILAEAGNLKRFRHVRQFLKYCGFDLATYQSGSTKGVSTLSKRGNARLRQMFWMAATIAIRMRENTFRKKFTNYTKEDPTNGNLKRKAYTAVAAKMARVAYSMIRHGTDYYCTHKERQW